MLEEQQIQEYVHRAMLDERIRRIGVGEHMGVSMPQDVSPRVAQILACLVPYLAFEQRPIDSSEKWWHV